MTQWMLEWLTSPWFWVAIVAVTGLLGVAHYHFWVRRLLLPLDYSETISIETEDGSAIVLRRLEAPDAPQTLKKGAPPVLLVHGIAVNHRNIDAEADRSLARLLHESGRDVWLLTLRCGRPDRRLTEPVNLRAMVEYDLPLAVRTVCDRTGADALDFVGFSMGGMLMYGALPDRVSPSRVRRAVFLGSPARIIPPFGWLRRLGFLAPLVPPLPIRTGARMTAFASEWLGTPLHSWIYNRRNTAPQSTSRALVNLIEGVPRSLSIEFVRWASNDEGTVDLDGTPLLAGLDRVKDIEALFVAGSGDYIAPPKAVRTGYEAWGCQEKEFCELGKETGASEDYGHGDLAIGRDVRTEVFERIRDFLNRPTTPDEAPSSP